MTEKKLQIRALLKLLCVVGFSFLYAWGGMENLWLRRYVAPVWLGLSMFFFSRDWRVFLQVPLLIGGLSLGYGSEVFIVKILKRFLFGFACAFTNITHLFDKNMPKRAWEVLFILSLITIPMVSIALGVFNPVQFARYEEIFIGFFIGVFPMFIIRDKESAS